VNKDGAATVEFRCDAPHFHATRRVTVSATGPAVPFVCELGRKKTDSLVFYVPHAPLSPKLNKSATLRGYVRAVPDAGADIVLLTSFNEWSERTVVEPSLSWPAPYFCLRILADWKGVAFTPPLLPGVAR
jgi:hypothetical protein